MRGTDPAARLRSVKVLGTFLGDEEECSRRLCARVADKLEPLKEVVKLRDTRTCSVAGQVRHCLARFCSNTSLVYFVRTMGVEATRAATHLHDDLVERAFHTLLGSSLATDTQRRRAFQQARLPVRLGGLGLTQHASPEFNDGSLTALARSAAALAVGETGGAKEYGAAFADAFHSVVKDVPRSACWSRARCGDGGLVGALLAAAQPSVPDPLCGGAPALGGVCVEPRTGGHCARRFSLLDLA